MPRLAEQNRIKLAQEAAEAILNAPTATFAERNRARIILKRIKKGQKLK